MFSMFSSVFNKFYTKFYISFIMFTSIFREEDPGEMYQVPANDEEEKRGEKRKINENENEKNHVVPEFQKSLVVPESPVSSQH